MRRADLADLTAFVAVADNLSFRAAASHIGVTPSALSHTMRQLEERRAVPLQVLAVSGQPLVVSVTLPRFPFAKTGSPFATGGPRVRILLPPARSQQRTMPLP